MPCIGLSCDLCPVLEGVTSSTARAVAALNGAVVAVSAYGYGWDRDRDRDKALNGAVVTVSG